MAPFIPKEKLSKKERKKLDRERRCVWAVPPVTRVVESKKLYNRKRHVRDRYGDPGTDVFLSVISYAELPAASKQSTI
ncbi:MAG: hypothetical protein J5859_02400 [Clostridia bacterium]|nr:hypothetical protein [Clostridia bacterium]